METKTENNIKTVTATTLNSNCVCLFFQDRKVTFVSILLCHHLNLWLYAEREPSTANKNKKLKLKIFREYPAYFNPSRAALVKFQKGFHHHHWGFSDTQAPTLLLSLFSVSAANMSETGAQKIKSKHVGPNDSSRTIWWPATMKFQFYLLIWLLWSFSCE